MSNRSQPAAPAPSGDDVFLALQGLNCPRPVLRRATAGRAVAPGTRVRVIATDPMAKLDVAHFCRTKGHMLLETGEEEGVLSFLVETGEDAAR